jgi:arylsulfatase A-like enzyme
MSTWRSTPKLGLLAIFALLPSVVGTVAQFSPPQAEAIGSPPNIVLILTDDQRADTLRYMPIVRRSLGNRGVTFENAYVVDPVCCPSRASILTGLYPHSTRVYSNDPNGLMGGFPAFDDGSTIATRLQAAGYHTGLFGKYLNGYQTEYVPPGWDRWFGMHESAAYYRYEATSDGAIMSFGADPDDYGTTVLASEATTFIRETPSDQPLFAYISVAAPHSPAIAAPRDLKTFETLRPWRPPNYNERDISDKPRYLRRHAWLDGEHRREIDAYRLAQIRSLQAVDRLVGDTIDALKATGRISNTIIVFTSDNGVLWGEHRWNHKDVPYEESIAVPMIVRYDALIPDARRDANLVLNVDLAPTFADAAGATTPPVEGASFLPLLLDPTSPWRDGFLIEHMASRSDGVPSYCGYHTGRYVFVRYNEGESELYDLEEDPWQLENRDDDPALAEVRSSLNEELVAACRPLPPNLILRD